MGKMNGYETFGPGHDFGQQKPSRRLTTPMAILIAVLGSVLLICGIGSCTALLAETPAPQPTVTITQTVKPSSAPASPTSSRTATTAPPKSDEPDPETEQVKSVPEILGTDLVLVGEDVPAGTYRVVERVTADPWCYWAKYSDSEGSDIISNDIVKAGRPQVTLKKGQWFKSAGCPIWRKR